MNEDIVDALENSARARKDRGRPGDPAVADAADIRLWRDAIMRFLEDLDGSYTVSDIKDTLEDYA